MSQNSSSNTTSNHPRPWLQALYRAKRQRTVDLVKASVDRLKQEGQVVTIEAICRLSKDVDPLGSGIKKAGVLGNAEAYAYYRQHSASYQRVHRHPRSPRSGPSNGLPPRIDPERDVQRVRQRYRKLSKAGLIEQLLSVEQAYAQLQQQLARLQFEFVELQQSVTSSKLNP